MSSNIEKSWCIYKGILFFPQGVGRIEEESETTARVRYSEGQLYPPEAWDKKYLERFETVEMTIDKFIKDTGDTSTRQLVEKSFPEAFKKDDSV